MQDEIHYKLLSLIEKNPEATQRELADNLGVSVGKINYCLTALVNKGQIKIRNFTNSNNKAAYAYLLTPKGLKQKAKVTIRFLKSKTEEYEQLQKEIALLKSEVNKLGHQVSVSGDEVN
jgi:MarR family transcriptional regulator, temperature-dependent positive regulator of motility